MDGHHSSVSTIAVRVGALSGVVPEALRSAFDSAAAGTMLSDAVLRIERVDVAVWCESCDAERAPTPVGSIRLRCPECGAPTPKVLRGRELELAWVELDDWCKETTSAANS